jgi:site-specific DNA recombinase
LQRCTGGGNPWTKGAVDEVLSPTASTLESAGHKGIADPGEHEPIIDRASWDRVHEVLATKAKCRGNEAWARTPALLRGLMRCTQCNSAMTPTHTRRRGRRHRY